MHDIIRQRERAGAPAFHPPAGAATRTTLHIEPSASRYGADHLVVEEPLEIRLGTESIAVTMRTPGHDDELAVGFLYNEGILRHLDDLHAVAFCTSTDDPEQRNIVTLNLAPEKQPDLSRLHRHFYTTSSCGVCGKTSIEAVMTNGVPIESSTTFDAQVISGLDRQLREAQPIFEQTGALHAAGIFEASGKLLVLREDVGRHNAVDKAVGYMFLHGRLPLDQHILMVSGRDSFEIVQKSLMARLPVVAAVSGPSSLAVELAEESNITLIGFLRCGAFNVYSKPARLCNLPRAAEKLVS